MIARIKLRFLLLAVGLLRELEGETNTMTQMQEWHHATANGTFTILDFKPKHCCNCKKQLRPRHTSGHRSKLCVSCSARIASILDSELHFKQSWRGIAKEEGYNWERQQQFGIIDIAEN